MKRIFQGVAGNNPRLNRFDLSYTNTLSMTFGYLYPVQCDEVTPGDVWKMSCYCHAELTPLVAPVMSDIQMFAHVFFVPYRLIYGVDNEDGKSIWEKFITGGEDGEYDTPLPAWNPSWTKVGFSSLKIWDYVGNPVSYTVATQTWAPIVPGGLDVSVAPRLSYNFIYNSFYRDEFLVDEVSLDNEDLLKCAFKKDYFTSALENQQLGTAPAFELSGTAPVSWASSSVSVDASGSINDVDGSWQPMDVPGMTMYSHSGEAMSFKYDNGVDAFVSSPVVVMPSGSVSFANAGTFNVSDMRLNFALQRMMELTQRSGYRYTEWLSAHYGSHPTDARLDRPEYIGGAVLNVTVSPLVQNSGTETAAGTQKTPQGNKAGIGHVDAIQKLGSYRVLEHGLIMTLVSIRPKPIYKTGLNRQWLRQVKEDYYIPELAYLSEQGVYNAELYTGGTSDVDDAGNYLDPQIFGYQAHWNEMRCKQNIVSGAVREQFSYWTLARPFATRPALNQDFIEIDPSDFNQIFAVQNEDPFVVSWSNLIDAYRPLPAMGIPGLIDHVYGGSYYG